MVEVLTNRRGRQVRCWIFCAGGGLLLLFLLAGALPQIRAAQLTEAEVTRIIKQVELLPERTAPRPATVKDLIRGGTAVRTGIDSRTELTFPDQTLTRLGASTTFSFNEGTRTIDLGTGAMLLYAPKGSGGAKISTAAVTAAITGTTVMIEYHPPKEAADGHTVNPNGDNSGPVFGLVSRKLKSGDLSSTYIKFITLEGVAQIFLNTRPGEPILVPAGHMLLVSPDGSSVNMIEVNLAVLVATCPLIADFPTLGSAPLIADEIAKQQAEGPAGGAPLPDDIPPNDIIDQAISGIGLLPGGGISGSEFGPLNTITAPVPYIINSGTQIVTAPTITTGGTTSFGKIYRGQPADGPAAIYFFGTQSTFDSDSGFNALGEGGNSRNPTAAFKFTSLQIAGDPVITVPPGGASNLTLVSENGITSGAGGALTFAGMNNVMLFTQNGSINLGAGISFSNLNLFFYARGAAGNIVLASPMTNMGVLEFDAEGSVQVNANETANVFNSFTGTFMTGTGIVTAAAQISIVGQTQIDFNLARFAIGPGAQVFLNSPQVNIDATANAGLFQNASLVNVTGAEIDITGGSTMTFGSATQVDFEAGAGGFQASGESFSHPGNLLVINSNSDLVAQQIMGGASIFSFGNITTTALLNSRTVDASGLINAGQLSVLFLNQSFTPSNSLVTIGAGGITPYLPQPGAVHRFSAMTISSTGGINFSGNNFTTTPGANGATLFLTDQTQIFGAGGIVGANFNGGDSGGVGQAPGNGGTLAVTTGGNLSVNGTTISATTGIIPTNDPPGGIGGTVNLTSNTGNVTVNNSTIQVSSDDPAGTAMRRSSAQGGNINIASGANTGVAVNITSSAQLRSLLETGAPGPGGVITVSATSATGDSSINVQGTIEAENGTSGHSAIDIRHSSNSGSITVATGSNMVRADIIKIATLGDASTLNINNLTSISAITLLRLYAGSISSANMSTINFTGLINLSGAEIDIAANTVNLIGSGTMVVTSSQAHVYTNNANYTGSGGNNSPNTGMFTGSGATTMTLDQAPALGPPGGTAPALSAATLNFPANRSIDLNKNRPGLPERTVNRPDRPFSP